MQCFFRLYSKALGCRARETPLQFEWTQVHELMASLYVSDEGRLVINNVFFINNRSYKR